MRSNHTRYICLACLLFSTVISRSQTEIPTLAEVSFTAHGNQQPIRKTGRNIWIVPGSLLSRAPIHSIDDLLRFIPGLEIQQRGPQGVQGDLLIRGGTFQQVLVLIDGVRLNDPLTGHFNAYIPIDPLEIERIEILKGPAAAIWGSEAVGGVVHIFTKTFTHKKIDDPTRIQGSIGLGEYNLRQGQLRAQLQKKYDRFSLSAATRNSDGAPQRGTRGYFNLHTVQAAWQHAFQNGWRLNMRSAWDARDFSAQNFYTTFASDTANEQVNSWWNHVQAIKSGTKGQWQADLSYKKTSDRYQFRPNALPNENNMGFAQFQMRYQRKTDQRFQYQLGVQAFQRRIRSNDRGNHDIEQGTIFGIGEYQLHPNWVANVGLRLTHDELYGNILIPQLSLSQSTENRQWRFSIGRSYRDADFTERYNNYNKISVSSGRIGNPDLSPEDAWQAEIGYDYSWSNSITFHMGVFYRAHSGLIDWINTPFANMPRQINLMPGGTYALAKNVERVNSFGWETDLQFRDSIGNGVLFAQAGLLWLNNEAPSGGAGFYLNSHARFLLNGLIQYRIGRWDFFMSGLYKKRSAQSAAGIGATLSPSYFVSNGRISRGLGKGKYWPYLQIDNILDASFSDLLGAPMPGRWLSGGIRVTL